MRIIQTIIQKLACVVVLAGGVALAIFSLSELYSLVISQLPGPNQFLRMGIGIVAFGLAFIALVPFGGRRRKSNQLSFVGPHGPITIQLDSIAASLNKTVSKLSIIKKAHLRLEPVKSREKANVVADVSIAKPADAGARETAEQLEVYIKDLARSVIGADEVGEVTVNVLNITTEGAAPADTLATLTKASATAPAAQAIVEPEPVVVEEEPDFDVSESVPEDLVTYEESMQAAEEEQKSLTGENDAESELPVAWDTVPEEMPAEDEGQPEESDADDTSFDSLAGKQALDEDDPENRPSPGA